MNRVAFKMKLKPGMKMEYKRRHDELWPELIHLLKEAGISEYSIFLDEETNILFGFQKVADRLGSQDLGQHEIVKKWWKYMADLMETHSNNSPITENLEEVFYLD